MAQTVMGWFFSSTRNETMTKANKTPTPSASTDASEQTPAFEAYNTAQPELHNPIACEKAHRD